MNKGVIVGIVIILAAASFVGGFFVHHHLHGDDEKDKDTPKVVKLKADLERTRKELDELATESRPKLWLDKAAAGTFKQFGYDTVYFIRWQNAVIDGWIEFDGADGPKRVPLDECRKTAEKGAKDGLKIEAKETRGNLLLGLRQIGKSDEFDCEVKGDYSVGVSDPKNKGGVASVGSDFKEKGKVKMGLNPIFKGSISHEYSWGPDEVTLKRFVNEKAVPWAQIKLIELPK